MKLTYTEKTRTVTDPDGWIIATFNPSATQAPHWAQLLIGAPDLLAACREFVRKVECGEAKSTRSYEQMKKAIAKATLR